MIGVIPAAGIGERMQPLSIKKPKPLLPVLNQPVIEYSLKSLRKAGIEDIYVVVGYRKDDFSYLEGVRFVEQEVLDGALSAIKKVEKYIDENFIVMWGDNFFRGDLTNLINSSNSENSIATVVLDREESSGAKVFLKDGKISRFEERPEVTGGYCPAGVYVFSPDVFDYIEKVEKSESGEFEISDLLQLLADEGEVDHVWFEGWRMNITTPFDLLRANLRALDESGNDVYSGGSIINSEVRRSVVGDGVEIENSTVTNSLILNNSRIRNCRLHNTVMDSEMIIEGFIASKEVISN